MLRNVHYNFRQSIRVGAACAWAVVFGLAGCEEDDGASTQVQVSPAVAVAAAATDTVSVAWNATSTLSVTDNDTVANGAAVLSISTPPAHGSAVVDGIHIRYTPAAGYFGRDVLSYTLTVGTAAPSTAEVNISVAAALTLSGTVADAPLPGAAVVATVGGLALPPVIADTDGSYTVAISSADPTALISLKATGAGAQSTVVLTRVVGDMAQAASAAVSGVVSATALPTTDVTHLSTAAAVLTQRALGKVPTSAADIASVKGKFSMLDVVNTAVAIKLVADAGTSLPTGVVDTLALVSDATALRTFLAAQAASVDAARTAILTDPALAVAPKVPVAGESPQTLLLVVGTGAAGNVATKITLRSDHTGVVTNGRVHAARWAVSGTALVLTYDSPDVQTTYTGELINGEQQLLTLTTTGLVVRAFGGDSAAGLATLVTLATSTLPDGTAYSPATTAADAGTPLTVADGTSPFAAAVDFAPGARWAGVLAVDQNAEQAVLALTDQDVLRFVDSTTAVFERANVNVAYTISDGKLVLTLPSGDTVTYQRLFTGPRGEERWLVEAASAGAPLYDLDLATFKVQVDAAPFTVGNLSHDWESYINAGISTDRFSIDLRSDGSSASEYIADDGTTSVSDTYGTWAIDGQGHMVLTRPTGSTRTWQLFGTVGNRIYVMEELGYAGNVSSRRLNVYQHQ